MTAKTNNMGAPTEWQKGFVQGYAACLSAAISLEDYRPSQIGGGIVDEEYLRLHYVDEEDIRTIIDCKD